METGPEKGGFGQAPVWGCSKCMRDLHGQDSGQGQLCMWTEGRTDESPRPSKLSQVLLYSCVSVFSVHHLAAHTSFPSENPHSVVVNRSQSFARALQSPALLSILKLVHFNFTTLWTPGWPQHRAWKKLERQTVPLQHGLLQGVEQLKLYGTLLSLYNCSSFRC